MPLFSISFTPLLSGNQDFYKIKHLRSSHTACFLHSFNIDEIIADVFPRPTQLMLPIPDLSFTPTSKSDLPSLQR